MNMKIGQRYKKAESGFTLLELVLVLFILTILTTTSLSFIENEDGQLRYDESINKIDFILDSLLKERLHKGNEFYTGFIYDNGTIPPDAETDLTPFISDNVDWSDSGGDTWITNGIVRPYYDLTGSAAQQLANEQKYDLRKGFRGEYLTLGLDSSSNFRDAWNENYLISPDNTNHQYDITFDGTNKSDFVSRTISLEDNDWSISPTTLDIRIANNSSSTINSGDYEVAVLVFVNDSVSNEEDRWQTFHFEINTNLLVGEIFESTSASWEISGTAIGSERIPVSEHLVILIDNNASTVNGDAEITDSQQFLVFQNSNQPEINLEVP